jgi:biopolymer transport protein ExbD
MLSQYKRSLLTQRPSIGRVKRQRGASYCRINAAPIASILVTLWLLFVMRLPGSDMPRWGSVELVNATHSVPIPSALRDDAIYVGLSASGDVYFDQVHIDLDDLGGRIRKDVRTGAENRIYFNVDSRARYADVKAVLQLISSAGIENITFFTK